MAQSLLAANAGTGSRDLRKRSLAGLSDEVMDGVAPGVEGAFDETMAIPKQTTTLEVMSILVTFQHAAEFQTTATKRLNPS